MSMASGQRGWKRHPEGGSARFGGAPGSAVPRSVIADARQAGDEMGGVGMHRIVEELRRRSFFHQPARIHDAEPVGDIGMNRQIMGDEDHRGSDGLLGLADHRQHILLHHDVERGGRLVGDDEFRLADGGERDGDALAHAARQFVRIGSEHVGLEAQALEMLATCVEESPAWFRRMWWKAKSRNEFRTRRTGFSTFIEPWVI